jgi:hypothetical protein
MCAPPWDQTDRATGKLPPLYRTYVRFVKPLLGRRGSACVRLGPEEPAFGAGVWRQRKSSFGLRIHGERFVSFPSVARGNPKVGHFDYPAWAEEPMRVRSSRRRITYVAIATLVILLAVYLVAATALSRRDYGIFAFWKVPDRIDYCGRRYYRAGNVSGTPGSFLAQVSGQPKWRTVGRTFTLRRIEAPVSPPTSRTAVCTMALYVSTGGRNYVLYSLSGGP